MDLQAAIQAASKAAVQIDTKTKTKLAKYASKYGMTEAEVIDLSEALFVARPVE